MIVFPGDKGTLLHAMYGLAAQIPLGLLLVKFDSWSFFWLATLLTWGFAMREYGHQQVDIAKRTVTPILQQPMRDGWKGWDAKRKCDVWFPAACFYAVAILAWFIV